MAPADRSNSPPIISKATATAMMPSVDAGSRYRAAPPSVGKMSLAAAVKMRKTATAPMIEPTSGLISMRRTRPTLATRSSTAWVTVAMPHLPSHAGQ